MILKVIIIWVIEFFELLFLSINQFENDNGKNVHIRPSLAVQAKKKPAPIAGNRVNILNPCAETG